MSNLRLVDDDDRPLPKGAADIKGRAESWLVHKLLPRQGVGWVVANWSAGKTFWLIDAALTIATERSLLGKRTKQAAVIYVALEDAYGIEARIEGWFKHHDVKPDETTPFFLVQEPLNLLGRKSFEGLCLDIASLASMIWGEQGIPLGLVIIDTWARAIPGIEEKDSKQTSLAYERVQHIANRFGCLVLMAGHFSKAGEQNGIRGWSGLDAASDVTIIIDRDSDRDSHQRVMRVGKLRNASDSFERAFELRPVDLGRPDEAGEPLTTLAVEYHAPEDRPGQWDKRKVSRHGLLVSAMNRCLDDGRCEQVANVPGVPPGTQGVRREALKDIAYRMGYSDEDESREAVRRRINRDLKSMIEAGDIRATDQLVWFVRRRG